MKIRVVCNRCRKELRITDVTINGTDEIQLWIDNRDCEEMKEELPGYEEDCGDTRLDRLGIDI